MRLDALIQGTNSQKNITRQLLMGAGHCPWGRYTDRNVCNILGKYEGYRSKGSTLLRL